MSGYASRDQVCSGNANIGIIHSRLQNDGTSLGLEINKNVSGGQAKLRYYEGVTEADGNGSAATTLATVSQLTTGFGFDASNAEDDRWDIRVEGFSVALTWAPDAVTPPVVVYESEFEAWQLPYSGRCAWMGFSGGDAYGMNYMHATHLADVALYSDSLVASEIGAPSGALLVDLRDVGFSDFQTTGSMAAGSATLTVADASGFAVGDGVIVEIKTDSDDPRGDTTGVGGYWPGQSAATVRRPPRSYRF